MRFHVKHLAALALLLAHALTLSACPAPRPVVRPDPNLGARTCLEADTRDPEAAAARWITLVREGKTPAHSAPVADRVRGWKQVTPLRSWSPTPTTTHVLLAAAPDDKNAVELTITLGPRGAEVTSARPAAPDALVPDL